MTVRPSRRFALFLAASLGINLFLGGMLASQWLFQRGSPFAAHMLGPPKSGAFDRAAARAALDQEYRAVVDAIWQRNRPALHGYRRQMMEARDAIREKLLTEDFDPEAVLRVQAVLSAKMQEATATVAAHIVEIAQALPPEQRRRYFEAGLRHRLGPAGPFDDPPDHPPR